MKGLICDCAPKGRRSLRYDTEALESQKEHKPKNSASALTYEMALNYITL